jgi:cytochrome o ubiquinol oxidase subunit 3
MTHETAAADTKTIYGFWIYLMTDCILFATLFATYAVLQHNTFGGPSAKDLFSFPYALSETLILLTSSFTSGLALLAGFRSQKKHVIFWLAVTALLGLAFLTLEIMEFVHLVQEGNSWTRSAFLSSFFTLVSTHGLHITAGLLWVGVLFGQIIPRGLNHDVLRRLICFTLFWHFLDIVWVFIFSIVFLLGGSGL